MTTIILSVIGIILAAASAIMVTFYGGSSFDSARVNADANMLQGAGVSIISSVNLARLQLGSSISLTGTNDQQRLSSFLGLSGPGGTYLASLPHIPSGLSQGLTSTLQYRITDVPATSCTRLNSNLKIATPTSITTTVKMGCFMASGAATGTFFANP
jgi:hypothetical protein